MRDANFFAVFVGIESPDPETLIQMRKKQNTKRNIAESIQKIYGYGMFVTAGFIVGFDTEKVSIAHSMTEFIEECCVPVCMVGLLYALPGTQLTRRLEKEGRLHPGHDIMRVEQAGDQCTTRMMSWPGCSRPSFSSLRVSCVAGRKAGCIPATTSCGSSRRATSPRPA